MICSWHPTPTSSLASFSLIAQALATLAFLLFRENTNLIPTLHPFIVSHIGHILLLLLSLPCWSGACPNIPFSRRHLFHCSAVLGGKTAFPLPLLQGSNCDSGLAIRHTRCSVRGECGPEGGRSVCDNAAVSSGVYFSVVSNADVPMSAAYVHTQRQDEGLQGVCGQGHGSWSSHCHSRALGVFPGHAV